MYQMEKSRKERCFYRTILPMATAMLSSITLLVTGKIPSWEETLKLTRGSTNRILTTLMKLRLSILDERLLGLLVFLALWVFWNWFFQWAKREKKKVSISSAVLALIFAVIMPVGMSIETYKGLDFLLANRFQMCFAVFLIFGYWILFYALIEILYWWLDQKLTQSEEKMGFHEQRSEGLRRLQVLLLDKKPIVIPMAILLICWLPYWIAYFPGSVAWDALVQFNYYFGETGWSAHHPVFVTILYGTLMKIGRTLSSDSLGVFFCVLFQQLMLSASMAYAISSMKKWNCSLNTRSVVLLYFSLFPLVSLWSSVIVKDCVYYPLIICFGVVLIDLLISIREKRKCGKEIFYITLLGIIISLIRHDGLYLCIGSIFLLIVCRFSKSCRIGLIASVCVVALISGAASDCLMQITNATEGSKREALSIPFQQTARYVVEHGDEVTDAERKAINAVLDYDSLAERYDSDCSDNVKATYREDDSALPEYFQTWFAMFWKHPITYLEATLCNTYSYYYPNGESTEKQIVLTGIPMDKSVNTGYFDLNYSFSSSAGRTFFDNGCLLFAKKLPGLGMLFHAGTYTWILLLAAFFMIRKRRTELLLGLSPALLNILICIASPVNGYFRYFMPTIFLSPIIIGWMLAELKLKKEEC